MDKWPGDLLKDESDLLTAKQEGKGAKGEEEEDEEEMEEEEMEEEEMEEEEKSKRSWRSRRTGGRKGGGGNGQRPFKRGLEGNHDLQNIQIEFGWTPVETDTNKLPFL